MSLAIAGRPSIDLYAKGRSGQSFSRIGRYASYLGYLVPVAQALSPVELVRTPLGATWADRLARSTGRITTGVLSATYVTPLMREVGQLFPDSWKDGALENHPSVRTALFECTGDAERKLHLTRDALCLLAVAAGVVSGVLPATVIPPILLGGLAIIGPVRVAYFIKWGLDKWHGMKSSAAAAPIAATPTTVAPKTEAPTLPGILPSLPSTVKTYDSALRIVAAGVATFLALTNPLTTGLALVPIAAAYADLRRRFVTDGRMMGLAGRQEGLDAPAWTRYINCNLGIGGLRPPETLRLEDLHYTDDIDYRTGGRPRWSRMSSVRGHLWIPRLLLHANAIMQRMTAEEFNRVAANWVRFYTRCFFYETASRVRLHGIERILDHARAHPDRPIVIVSDHCGLFPTIVGLWGAKEPATLVRPVADGPNWIYGPINEAIGLGPFLLALGVIPTFRGGNINDTQRRQIAEATTAALRQGRIPLAFISGGRETPAYDSQGRLKKVAFLNSVPDPKKLHRTFAAGSGQIVTNIIEAVSGPVDVFVVTFKGAMRIQPKQRRMKDGESYLQERVRTEETMDVVVAGGPHTVEPKDTPGPHTKQEYAAVGVQLAAWLVDDTEMADPLISDFTRELAANWDDYQRWHQGQSQSPAPIPGDAITQIRTRLDEIRRTDDNDQRLTMLGLLARREAIHPRHAARIEWLFRIAEGLLFNPNFVDELSTKVAEEGHDIPTGGYGDPEDLRIVFATEERLRVPPPPPPPTKRQR